MQLGSHRPRRRTCRLAAAEVDDGRQLRRVLPFQVLLEVCVYIYIYIYMGYT